jgi:hypothetical protein
MHSVFVVQVDDCHTKLAKKLVKSYVKVNFSPPHPRCLFAAVC